MKKDDYVKIVSPDGNYRYGYINEVLEKGYFLGVNLFDEGASKIAFDAECSALVGVEPEDYISLLTDVEKRVVPLLATGLKTSQIAQRMGISPVTVRSHLRTLRIKLHLDNKAQLEAFSEALDDMIKKKSR